MSAVDLNFFPNLTSCKIGKMTEVREDGEASTESRTDFSACLNRIAILLSAGVYQFSITD
ncbi:MULTISPECIES: hypothetical protein [Moorena]|uniref:Uncharacterized protein n=1 Tax=Moorena producens 3L TaxID=489825 RepID=F4XIE3_9CYAN|nr:MULTISPECIES: hypothetical protein [Moorena]EGJ35676.1 hypothetical protein LYNGBM3L_01350 [Moorena producens 3L]NEP35129.1 hypothetical protein [Moorena sp. SIO3B2]NEP66654.1 hypothetical protein [Moorena sp. SIO3A5]OLT67513.1 hypothetical protein BI334_22995 [Moorena producens 3L]